MSLTLLEYEACGASSVKGSLYLWSMWLDFLMTKLLDAILQPPFPFIFIDMTDIGLNSINYFCFLFKDCFPSVCLF